MHTQLENDDVLLAVNETGALVTLLNKRTARNYAGRQPLWRLYLQNGPELDIEVRADSVPQVSVADGCLRLHYPYLLREDGGPSLAIAVHIEARLHGDEVRWSIALTNDEPGAIVRECHFPLVGGLPLTNDTALITSKNGGERITDLHAELLGKGTDFMAPDHLSVGFTLNYPFPAATNCFVIEDRTGGLYFGRHRQPVTRTLHQFRHYATRGVEVGFVLFPGIGEGQDWTCDACVVSPYAGTWHTASRKYRQWADNWFRKPAPPAWVSRLNGWQRIIMQHQYAKIHYTFGEMPRIHAEGYRSGIDTLFMFGWQKGGHDNNYPDYVPEPRLGTEEELRAGVEHFNRNGGHVLLYANGRLIDTTSRFYRETGRRISVKDLFENEVRDAYEFRGPGNFVAEFARRSFVAACPSCPEWFDVLRDLADRAISLKCHSLFLDQAGMSEYPCCDPTHDHPPLWMESIQAKADALRRLRDYLRAADPELALGIELLNDVTAQHVDYVHGLVGGCAVAVGSIAPGVKPRSRGFLEWFRYTFPEVILSDREIRDDTDIERRVNHAVLLGLRSDVEIYRCRKTIAEAPRYAAWLAKINGLRQKHADLLLEGRYVDVDGITCDGTGIDARVFANADERAVVVTQSHLDSATAIIGMPGFDLERWDTVGDATAAADGPGRCAVVLPRHGLLVLRWRSLGDAIIPITNRR